MREDAIGADTATAVRDRYEEIIGGLHRNGDRGDVLFCVSSDDLGTGKGDLYVALGLANALRVEGWGVSLWTIDRMAEETPAGIDVAVIMIESWVPGYIHPDTHVVAWVRNWTDEWAALPYLEEFAEIWCSSNDSARAIAAVYDGLVRVVPLATDPELFRPDGRERTAGVVTTANYWGVARSVQPALERVATEHPVVWYGVNSAFLDLADGIDHRDAIDYFALPEVYSGWPIVVDDLIGAAARHGNQNSRLFDALACGALVITNESRGLEELGLAEVPVYDTADGLLALVSALEADPQGTAARVERLREITVHQHSWAVRARALGEPLAALVARPAPGARAAILQWATRLREEMRRDRRAHDDYASMYFAAVRDAERLHQELGVLRAQHSSRAYRIAAGVARPINAVRRRLR